MSAITVLLLGGPDHFPEDARTHRADDSEQIVKCPFGAGYEHFRSTGERMVVGDQELPTYEWVGHTALAE